MMIYDKNKNSCGLRWQIDVFNLLTCILFWHNWGINQFRKTASVLPWPYDATVVWQCPDFQKFWLQSGSISTDCTDMIFVKLSLEIPWQWVLCWHIKKWLESSDDLDFGLTFLIKIISPYRSGLLKQMADLFMHVFWTWTMSWVWFNKHATEFHLSFVLSTTGTTCCMRPHWAHMI